MRVIKRFVLCWRKVFAPEKIPKSVVLCSTANNNSKIGIVHRLSELLSIIYSTNFVENVIIRLKEDILPFSPMAIWRNIWSSKVVFSLTRLTNPDHYLTTISENTEKAWSPCAARIPRFSVNIAQICAKPTKPLQIQGSSFYGLITPTLKAAGSNPVGRTSKRACCKITPTKKDE